MANRKNNHTVHFMVNDEDIKELNRRYNLTHFKTKREFYRDSIFKNKIICIDINGTFSKKLRKINSLISKNSTNINQISKVVNSTGVIYKDDMEDIKNLLFSEAKIMLELREKVLSHIYNEVID